MPSIQHTTTPTHANMPATVTPESEEARRAGQQVQVGIGGALALATGVGAVVGRKHLPGGKVTAAIGALVAVGGGLAALDAVRGAQGKDLLTVRAAHAVGDALGPVGRYGSMGIEGLAYGATVLGAVGIGAAHGSKSGIAKGVGLIVGGVVISQGARVLRGDETLPTKIIKSDAGSYAVEGIGVAGLAVSTALLVRNRHTGGNPWMGMAAAGGMAASTAVWHLGRTGRGSEGPLRIADQAIDKALNIVAPYGSNRRDIATYGLQAAGAAAVLYGFFGHNPNRAVGVAAEAAAMTTTKVAAKEMVKAQGKAMMASGMLVITYGQSLRNREGFASSVIDNTIHRPTVLDHLDTTADKLDETGDAPDDTAAESTTSGG